MPDRPHVVLLTVLPKERRARHPYQLCMMLALITLSVSQLIIGPAPNTAITALTRAQQDQLNWYALIGGLAGIAAAVIPERIVRIRHWRFDGTWARLIVELAAHGLLFFVWMSYLVAIIEKVPLVVGLTLGTGLVLGLATAAAWRAGQILWTIKRAVLDPPQGSGIVGAQTIEETLNGDGD